MDANRIRVLGSLPARGAGEILLASSTHVLSMKVNFDGIDAMEGSDMLAWSQDPNPLVDAPGFFETWFREGQWQTWVLFLAVAAASVGAALILHYVIVKVVGRFARRSKSPMGG